MAKSQEGHANVEILGRLLDSFGKMEKGLHITYPVI
jgi:hypothetical protein